MSNQSLIRRLNYRLDAKDRQRLRHVRSYGEAHLSSLKRRTGKSYAQHCLEVAATLREASNDLTLLSVALLHDILLHEDGKKLLAESPLTQEERKLVKQMNDLRRLHIDSNTKDLDKVIDAISGDPRLWPLRMAHRLNDVRHISRFSPTLRKRIASETLHMYTSIAGRLGMNAWRRDMENICFPLVRPKIAKKLKTTFQSHHRMDTICLERAVAYLKKYLKKHDITCKIESRIKALYSTYRKMVIKNRAFEDLTDRLAIRIIVDEVEDCYKVLGIVHACMRPIPGKLKDYIGAPKANEYRSIHTVVYPLPGVTDDSIEIQIRTHEMHEFCQYGPTAHGHYKHFMYALHEGTSRVNLFSNLQTLREEVRSPEQFEKALRRYFSQDHIAVFDHKNNFFHMKKPATALDAVYYMHPDKWQFLRSVKVNGRTRTLDTELADGDTIEPFFAKTNRVKEPWKRMCNHNSVKKALRAASTTRK